LTESHFVITDPQPVQTGGAERQNDPRDIAIAEMLCVRDDELGAHFGQVGGHADEIAITLRTPPRSRNETRLAQAVCIPGKEGVDLAGLQVEAAVAVHDTTPEVSGTPLVERSRGIVI